MDQPTSVTDAAGTRNFTYNSANQLANETIPGIVNGGLTYTYDTAGRRTAMSAGNGTTTFANAAYTYDAMGRIATVGNSADTLTYSYVPGTGMIASSSWQTATVNTAYTYDSYKRLTNIAVNSANVYGYTLNDKNQRTGATLPDGRTWSYSYDTLGQLTGAVKRDSTNTQLADLSYLYDQIGNRTSATENNTTTTYTSNLVNQYTQIASQVPTYDADGNMTSYNGWTYTWNGENRLVAAENSDTRLEFSYDYMGRRLEKKVYSKGLLTLYNWSLEKHRKFVYDGYKLIAEFDALASDTQLASYLWQPTGLDVPLMRIADNTQTYYIADGNKNIIALKDSSGADVSTYAYTPFGSLENPVDGDENPFRFSSEYADDETGLVYYNYRYYSPQLGRWTKRDPIEEEGGVNLYAYLFNDYINLFDNIGLGIFTVKKKIIDLTASGISVEAMTSGNPNGFSVDWTPSKADEAACKCGSFSLSQAISSNGLGGYSAHVDASKAERRANRNSGYNNPPPTMTPHGDSKYSYIDSPSAPQGPWPVYTTKFTLTAVAICIPKNNPQKWFVVDSITFTFNNISRTLSGPHGAENDENGAFSSHGTLPGDHWNEAEKAWRNQKR